MRVTDRREPPGHSQHREVCRLTLGDLVPVHGRRHARVRQWAHRVGRARRAVLRILVVVEEHAAPLFLPPLGRRQRRRASLHLARERERRASHLGERPPLLDTHVDVHPARAAGLRPPAEPELVQQGLRLHRDATDVVPRDAGARVEVDAELVGTVEVARSNGVRMQLDAAEVHDPRESRRVVDDDLLGRTA